MVIIIAEQNFNHIKTILSAYILPILMVTVLLLKFNLIEVMFASFRSQKK